MDQSSPFYRTPSPTPSMHVRMMGDDMDDDQEDVSHDFGLPTLHARVRMADRTSERFKGAADLGNFDGTQSKFDEWCTRAKAWIRCQKNWNTEKVAIAVWTRLQGGRAGQYGMARLQECMTQADEDPTADPWPTTAVLFEELTVRFQVILEHDYARQKIETFKQGIMKIDDFMVEFEALVTKSGITDLQAIDLLERNVHQDII
ncbi:hypothetical protein DXG03_003549 [Asterophora parasitica]|uniref:Retrotransposon gag domain-containing protein n=1 Tax=Asterophora parasitica TaxID=117018 RepID=A0A9P7FWS1_9AGAR|nr:hypothetical protein DXG03_003549 [Asterophora parasitica]